MSLQPLNHLSNRSLWTRARAWTALGAVLLFLVGCSATEKVPTASTPGGFVFSVDPADGLVTLREGGSSAPTPQSLLENGVDLGASYTYSFEPGNVLVIEAAFTNVRGDVSFGQPFFFTVNEATTNILSSEEPEVSDDDLGGDGVLQSGETTSTLTFRVQHKGEPFVYVVDANAERVGREVGFTQNEVIAAIGQYLDHLGVVSATLSSDLGVRALLEPLTGLEGQLPDAPADCGADACLPRGVYDYRDNEGEFGGEWLLVEPSDDLVLRYEVDDAPAVLSLDWDAGGETLVQSAPPGSSLSPPDAASYTYEVPTAPALSLLVDGVSAADLSATLGWTDDCSVTGIGLTRFLLNGSVGVDTTVTFRNAGFIDNNGVIGFTGTTTLTSGADIAHFEGFVEAGYTPNFGAGCSLEEASLDRVTLSLSTSVRVGGVITRLNGSLNVNAIVTDPDSPSAEVDGLLFVNGGLAVNLVGTLDDENGNGIPGENVTLVFTDNSVTTLETFIGRFAMTEGLSALLRLTR